MVDIWLTKLTELTNFIHLQTKIYKMTALQILSEKKLKELRERYPHTTAFDHQAKFSDKSEKNLEDCILQFAKFEGFQAERIKVKPNRIDKRQTVTDCIGRMKVIGSITWTKSSMQAGSADMSLTIKGRSVKAEIKMPGDHQKPNQKLYQQQVEAAGGEYWIVTSFQSFFDRYHKFIKNL